MLAIDLVNWFEAHTCPSGTNRYGFFVFVAHPNDVSQLEQFFFWSIVLPHGSVDGKFHFIETSLTSVLHTVLIGKSTTK